MFIVSKTQDEYGNYQKIKKWPELTPPDGYYWWPDYLEQDTFNQYKGFVNLVIQRDTVASYTPNQEAFDQYASLVNFDTPTEPSAMDVLKILLGVE